VLDGRDRDGKEVFEGVEFEGEQPAQPEPKENPLLPKWMQESQRQEELMRDQNDIQYSDDDDDDYDDEVEEYNENEEEFYEEDID
jgi:hypothetical protein